MSYLAAGYGMFTTIAHIISIEGFEGLSIGFYLILLSSIAIAVLTFLYNEKEADALINLSVSINKSVNNNLSNNQINTPIMSQPQVPIQEQQKPLRFDPMTGQPIYSEYSNNQLH